MREKSRLRRTISRWANSTEQEVRDLQEAHVREGALTVAEAPDRERVRIEGTLQTVTLRPRGGVPALEAELDDGTGVITLIWLGRRRIVGVGPGRRVAVEGRIGRHEGTRVLYNPRYELLP